MVLEPCLKLWQMGIKSLHKWLSWACKAPTAVNWTTFTNQTIGVDILGFIYRAKQDSKDPIRELTNLILLWKSNKIHPLFVFDGKSPPEKRGTASARRKQKEWQQVAPENLSLTGSERDATKQLLYATGCLYLNATGEADSLLAFLYRRGDIQAIVSMDMDFLARGCETLLVPYKSSWQHYSLSAILRDSELTYLQFLQLCVILGCDYTPTLPTLNYQRAYLLIRHKGSSLFEILKHEGIRNPNAWYHAMELLEGANDSWETLLSESQRSKWCLGFPTCEPEFCKSLGISSTDIEILSH